MAVILPEPDKSFDRDPTEGQFPSGTYPARLVRVSEIGPSAKFPDSGNRLVFEFEVSDGPYRGKKTTSFVGKKLWSNPKLNKESGLLKLARQLGCPEPMKGFDPDDYVGKSFNVTCELTGSGEQARAWVRFVTPAGPSPAPQVCPAPTPAGSPPRRSAPASKPAPVSYWVDVNPDADPISVPDLRKWFAEDSSRDPRAVLVCPEGGIEYKAAADYDAGLLF